MNLSSETSTAPIILATSFLSLFKIIVVGKPLKLNKFTNLSSNLIFNNIKKISKNIEKSLNNSTIEYCFNKNLINDWEYNFLYDTERKRKLTFKQYNKRVSINKKILHSFKSGML